MNIDVPMIWRERAREFSFITVDDYKNGRNEHSRRLSADGAENNCVLQCNGKICEIAGAMLFDVDPMLLHWKREPDNGFDFIKHGLRIDIKGSAVPNAKNLIWPRTKDASFNQNRCDVLVFVWTRIDDEGWSTGYCEARGWTSEACFAHEHKIAANDTRFKDGTRYMSQRDLWPMQEIIDGDLGFLAKRFDRTVEYVKGEWP